MLQLSIPLLDTSKPASALHLEPKAQVESFQPTPSHRVPNPYTHISKQIAPQADGIQLSAPIAGMSLQQPSPGQAITPNLYMLQNSPHRLHLITFGRKPKPAADHPPAIQFRLYGVSNLQSGINALAKQWEDGRPLGLTVTWGDPNPNHEVRVSDRKHGTLGYIPTPILNAKPKHWDEADGKKPRTLKEWITSYPDDFKIELSNIVAGTTRGAATTSVRVNLLYTGPEDDTVAQGIQQTFNVILNDPDSQAKILKYQPTTNPEQVLNRILDHESHRHGPEAALRMQNIIQRITKTLLDPNNKRILLLGHSKPDGDTLGSIIALKNALDIATPGKTIHCGVDDKIPGLFRDKLPGIEAVKRPPNPERTAEIKTMIETLQGVRTKAAKQQRTQLWEELRSLENPDNLLDPDAQYDAVVVLDVPTHKRFTTQFKPYLDNAKHVIYIDHHPHQYNEWQEAAPDTGLDMADVHEKGLAWIADSVAAAAQMVGVIVHRLPILDKLLADDVKPGDILPEGVDRQRFKTYVAALITGMMTDTGSFTRTANLQPDTAVLPVQDRPDFRPEGHAKWLIELTEKLAAHERAELGLSTHGDGSAEGDSTTPLPERINKAWLRNTITYDIPDNPLEAENQESARSTMIGYATDGMVKQPRYLQQGLGIIEVDYDRMNTVWQMAREVDLGVTLLDVQNGFKYSEVMGKLRENPKIHKNDPIHGMPDYRSPYDEKRIAILICQDKQAGALDDKMQFAETNGLRFSFRSADGNQHAELLAHLFGGGGHGSAAGGRVDGPNVTLTTPLVVKIGKKVISDPQAILTTLQENLRLLHDDLGNELLAMLEQEPNRILRHPGKGELMDALNRLTDDDQWGSVAQKLLLYLSKQETPEFATTLKDHHHLLKQHGLLEALRKALMVTVSVTPDPSGKPARDILLDVVGAIRQYDDRIASEQAHGQGKRKLAAFA